jgi:hypothetical protein
MTGLPDLGDANLAGHLASGGRGSWVAVAELEEVYRPETWMVVGGQMVAIHAARTGVVMARVATDVDVVVDVRAQRRMHAQRLSGWLVESGFEIEGNDEGTDRYRRGTPASISSHPTTWANHRCERPRGGRSSPPQVQRTR